MLPNVVFDYDSPCAVAIFACCHGFFSLSFRDGNSQEVVQQTMVKLYIYVDIYVNIYVEIYDLLTDSQSQKLAFRLTISIHSLSVL